MVAMAMTVSASSIVNSSAVVSIVLSCMRPFLVESICFTLIHVDEILSFVPLIRISIHWALYHMSTVVDMMPNRHFIDTWFWVSERFACFFYSSGSLTRGRSRFEKLGFTSISSAIVTHNARVRIGLTLSVWLHLSHIRHHHTSAETSAHFLHHAVHMSKRVSKHVVLSSGNSVCSHIFCTTDSRHVLRKSELTKWIVVEHISEGVIMRLEKRVIIETFESTAPHFQFWSEKGYFEKRNENLFYIIPET